MGSRARDNGEINPTQCLAAFCFDLNAPLSRGDSCFGRISPKTSITATCDFEFDLICLCPSLQGFMAPHVIHRNPDFAGCKNSGIAVDVFSWGEIKGVVPFPPEMKKGRGDISYRIPSGGPLDVVVNSGSLQSQRNGRDKVCKIQDIYRHEDR
jgi:hypothetical protein